MSKKSVEYEISFKSTAVSNHGINEQPATQPYYNKTIVFTGEGCTDEEQANPADFDFEKIY